MTSSLNAPDERIEDLLADRATVGLTEAEARQLDDLQADSSEADTDAFDLAAAAVDVALAPPTEALPAGLRARLLRAAPESEPPAPDAAQDRVLPAPARRSTLRFRFRDLGWFAAAAAVLLAVVGWWRPGVAPAPPAPTLAEQRRQLLGSPQTIRVAWKGLEAGYEKVEGDVVWNGDKQAGFMRLKGLPVNDPSKKQYQLWIVDPARDKHPIDGGVFDSAATGREAIVPIRAKLNSPSPKAFALTLEQPGGVVVSAGPLLVVASVQ